MKEKDYLEGLDRGILDALCTIVEGEGKEGQEGRKEG